MQGYEATETIAARPGLVRVELSRIPKAVAEPPRRPEPRAARPVPVAPPETDEVPVW